MLLQGRFSNPNLDAKAAEGLFREHLVQLQKRAVDSYIELLEEVHCTFPLAFCNLKIPFAHASCLPRENSHLSAQVIGVHCDQDRQHKMHHPSSTPRLSGWSRGTGLDTPSIQDVGMC